MKEIFLVAGTLGLFIAFCFVSTLLLKRVFKLAFAAGNSQGFETASIKSWNPQTGFDEMYKNPYFNLFAYKLGFGACILFGFGTISKIVWVHLIQPNIIFSEPIRNLNRNLAIFAGMFVFTIALELLTVQSLTFCMKTINGERFWARVEARNKPPFLLRQWRNRKMDRVMIEAWMKNPVDISTGVELKRVTFTWGFITFYLWMGILFLTLFMSSSA